MELLKVSIFLVELVFISLSVFTSSAMSGPFTIAGLQRCCLFFALAQGDVVQTPNLAITQYRYKEGSY